MQGERQRSVQEVFRAGYERGGAPSRAVVLALATVCLVSALAYLAVFLVWRPPYFALFMTLGALCIPAYAVAVLLAVRRHLVVSAVTTIVATLVCLVPFALAYSVTSGVQLMFLAAGFMTLVVIPERLVKTRLVLCGAVVASIVAAEVVAPPTRAAIAVDDPVYMVVTAAVRVGGIAIVLTALTLVLLRTARAESALTRLAHDEERRANTDLLTGIANRRPAMRSLDELDNDRTRPACLALVDIDRLKEINDDGGHAVGDAVIAEVAARLDAALSATCLVSRWGGDEFLIVSRDGGMAVADALAGVRADLASTPVADAPGPVTLSVGLAYRGPGETAAGVLAAADAALYAAKSGGRDRVNAAPPRRSA